MTDDLHGQVEARLRRLDQRYTAGRRALVDLLAGAGHPVSIGDLSEAERFRPQSHRLDVLGLCAVCQ